MHEYSKLETLSRHKSELFWRPPVVRLIVDETPQDSRLSKTLSHRTSHLVAFFIYSRQ
jgi:hypothetical protein